MSHLRPDDRSRKHRRSACRKGRHLFGKAQNIGAGITRQVCETCGEVTIDLTGARVPTTPLIRSIGKIGPYPTDT
ncbi:MAG TPA: hypothetical protein VF148_11100 [Acidimicrobiia bacterium]